MKPSDFFMEVENPLDPWGGTKTALDTPRIEQLRRGPEAATDDLEAAYGLAQLAHTELLEYGTAGNPRLSEEEITAVLRTLRAVLTRLGVTFDPPFRDFKGFHGYWSKEGMSGGGGWGARRGYLSDLFNPVFSRLDELEDERAGHGYAKGVDGQLKNLIFASTGPKPEIVLRDAINNVIEVTRNAEYCLFYDRPLGTAGLTWGELVDWWRDTAKLDGKDDQAVASDLYKRLHKSVRNNLVEELLFRTYCERYSSSDASSLPALIPQVYLHYDPLTRLQRGGQPSQLMRERMDFLLLLPGRVRIVIEVDGKQHYAEGDVASPRLYSEMVAEDRRLRLGGYEVYRFGGFELTQAGAQDMVRTFFSDLLTNYS